MSEAYEQMLFARSIRYDRSRVPEGKECYHGKPLMSCESWNCKVDSGRMEDHHAAGAMENGRSSPDGKPCAHGMYRCDRGCWA